MEVTQITFQADEQQLVKTSGIDNYASNIVNYVEADFTLGTNWTEFDSVSAMWKSGTDVIATVLDGEGKCLVPHELLEKRGELKVNLVGSVVENDELTERLTSFPIIALIVTKIAQVEGDETSPVTPSQFEQYVAIVHEDAQEAYDSKLDAESAQHYAEEARDEAVAAASSVMGLEATAEVDANVGTPSVAVSVTTEDDHKVMAFDFRNLKGETGQPGADGFSPIVTTTPIEGGTEVDIEDAQGHHTFNVLNGDVSNFYSFLPTDSASGSIASFPDGANNVPMLSLVAEIEPIQDLHGQDSPYPAGGGVNKFDKTAITEHSILNGQGDVLTNEAYEYAVSEYITISPNTAYYFKNVRNSLSGYTLWWYDENKSAISTGTIWAASGTSASASATSPNDAKYARVCIPNANIDDSAVNYPSTVTTYSPYSNICPISGRTEVKTVREGKNLCDGKAYYTRMDGGKPYLVDTTEITSPYTTTQVYGGVGFVAPVMKGQTYSLSTDANGSSDIRYGIYEKLEDVTSFSKCLQLGYTNTNFTANYDGYVVFFKHNTSSGVTVTWTYAQLELGSTPTTYEPYITPLTITIPLGQTVYGGTLDVVSGVLTVDRAMVDMGDWAWTYVTDDGPAYFRAYAIGRKVGAFNLQSSIYPVSNQTGTTNMPDKSIVGSLGSTPVYVKDSSYTNASDFTNAVRGQQLVYSLATPTTVQLTPQEVRTLLGTNNIWSDSGDTQVTYKADIQKYIDKQISAVLNA